MYLYLRLIRIYGVFLKKGVKHGVSVDKSGSAVKLSSSVFSPIYLK